ncbi:MAG: hypothetical protein ACPF9D_03475 [Owenweeksia sp.]
MKKLYILLFLGIITFCAQGQSEEYVFRNPQDSSFNCYLKVYPYTQEIKGIIIRDYSKLPDTSQKSPYRFLKLASEQGFMTIYTVTSPVFPELYYDDSGPALLDEILHEVISDHQLQNRPVFIGGISASGTRALRYAQYCAEGKSQYGHSINGVFAADPPLDLERFYRSAARIMQRKLEGSMLEEAALMLKVLPEQLGGTLDEKLWAYQEASVYSYFHPTGGNAQYFSEVPLLIYHEPDMECYTFWEMKMLPS